jgi:hypothetical protein
MARMTRIETGCSVLFIVVIIVIVLWIADVNYAGDF